MLSGLNYSRPTHQTVSEQHIHKRRSGIKINSITGRLFSFDHQGIEFIHLLITARVNSIRRGLHFIKLLTEYMANGKIFKGRKNLWLSNRLFTALIMINLSISLQRSLSGFPLFACGNI